MTTQMTPDSKVHGANIGPTWVLSAPDGPHIAPWEYHPAMTTAVATMSDFDNLCIKTDSSRGNMETFKKVFQTNLLSSITT